MKTQLIALAAIASLAITIGMTAPVEANPDTALNASVQCKLDIVQARDSEWFTLRVRANQIVDFALRGDGDTDLDLYVYDGRGNLIARDINPTDRASLRVISHADQTLRIEVRNLGRVWNQFALCVD